MELASQYGGPVLELGCGTGRILIYCLDDETNWLDWTLVAKHADVRRFVALLNARRLLRDIEHERQRMSLTHLIRQATKEWYGVKLHQPDWSPYSHSIAATVELRREQLLSHFILNAYWEPLEFELPPLNEGSGDPWRRWIDTALRFAARHCPVADRALASRSYLPG